MSKMTLLSISLLVVFLAFVMSPTPSAACGPCDCQDRTHVIVNCAACDTQIDTYPPNGNNYHNCAQDSADFVFCCNDPNVPELTTIREGRCMEDMCHGQYCTGPSQASRKPGQSQVTAGTPRSANR